MRALLWSLAHKYYHRSHCWQGRSVLQVIHAMDILHDLLQDHSIEIESAATEVLRPKILETLNEVPLTPHAVHDHAWRLC